MTPPRADAHGAWSCFASALAERHVVVRETPAATPLLQQPLLRAAAPVDDVVVPPAGSAPRALHRLLVLRQLFADDPVAHPAARSALWRRVFRTLELQRADAAIAEHCAGARADLARLRAETLACRGHAIACIGARAQLEALLRWALGGAATDHEAVRIAAQSTLDSTGTANQICAALCPRWRVRWGVDAPRMSPLPLDTPPMSPTGAGDAPVPGGPQRVAPGQARGGHGALADEPIDASGSSPPATALIDDTPPRIRTRALPASALRGSPRDAPEGRAHAIDEWDWRAQRFLPGWCTLYEQRLRGGDTRFIDAVRHRHAALAREVHRRFAALRPEALQRVHGADDGDELEIDRVIESRVERRAGRSHDRALYLRRDRAQRDVCAAFLVDTSASTDFVLRDPHAPPPAPATAQDDEVYLYAGALASAPHGPPPRRVIDVAKDALALMCDALQALGDRFAVYAFSGHGRAQVEFRIVKGFDDAVSARTAAALSALRPQGATRAGAAIRHASAQLARQPQRHKVLIVVSDGYPEDIDYGPEPRELRYAIEDTAHALREAAALGVDTFNLSIDPAGHDYLRRMCEARRYMVIDDLAALPGELTKVYQAMTRSAA